MHKVYLGLGTNLGDRASNFDTVLRRLNDNGRVVEKSPIYRSAPQYKTDQDYFWNAVVAFETDRNPHQLLTELKEIERIMGRLDGERYGPRVIDLDILIYEDVVLKSEALNIPHAGIGERAFVLMPLINLVGADFIAPSCAHDLGHYLAQLSVGDEVCERLSLSW